MYECEWGGRWMGKWSSPLTSQFQTGLGKGFSCLTCLGGTSVGIIQEKSRKSRNQEIKKNFIWDTIPTLQGHYKK